MIPPSGSVPSRLVFRQAMSRGLRGIVGAAGLFCFFPVYDLLIRPGLGADVLTLAMLPMWVISAGALALGLVLIAAAIIGPSRKMVFDGRARELRELGAGAFGLRWQRRHAFADLGLPGVRRDDSGDGPARFQVIVPRTAREPILVETYDDEAGATAVARRIAAFLKTASASP